MWIRAAKSTDADAMRAIVHAIIDEGDKTAIDRYLSIAEVSEWFITGPDVIATHIALSDDGAVLGFQSLDLFHTHQVNTADIGTFLVAHARGQGIGSALTTATIGAARTAAVRTIRAVIRRENVGAISFYRAQGFGGDQTDVASGRLMLERSV